MTKNDLFVKMDNRLKKVGAHSTDIHETIRENITQDNAYDIEQTIVNFMKNLRKAAGVE